VAAVGYEEVAVVVTAVGHCAIVQQQIFRGFRNLE
jgi:hypothetical protein